MITWYKHTKFDDDQNFALMMKNDDDEILQHDEKWKKFGAHTHFTPHMFTKCCNITTTVNNVSTKKQQKNN